MSDLITPLINNFPQIRLVYLFGSRVKGNVGPISDYDFAILVARESDAWAVRAAFAHEIGKALQIDRVDVVLLRKAPIELAFNIISHGQLIYEVDTVTRVEYEAEVISRYGDYLPILRQQRADILKGNVYAPRVQRYLETLRRTERALSEIETLSEQDAN